MQTIRFPRELSELVLARGNELLEVDFDGDIDCFLEVAETTLRFYIAEEARARNLPLVGPNVVEIDLVENLGTFMTYSLVRAFSGIGCKIPNAALKFIPERGSLIGIDHDVVG